jgi:hypothetical protein
MSSITEPRTATSDSTLAPVAEDMSAYVIAGAVTSEQESSEWETVSRTPAQGIATASRPSGSASAAEVAVVAPSQAEHEPRPVAGVHRRGQRRRQPHVPRGRVDHAGAKLDRRRARADPGQDHVGVLDVDPLRQPDAASAASRPRTIPAAAPSPCGRQLPPRWSRG